MEDNKNNSDRFNREAMLIGGVIVFVLVMLLIAHLYTGYGSTSSLERSELGTWGDYFGGTLNPILGFITIMVLIYTVRLQKQEMVDTRKELKITADAARKQAAHFEGQVQRDDLHKMIEKSANRINEIIDSEFTVNNVRQFTIRSLHKLFSVRAADARVSAVKAALRSINLPDSDGGRIVIGEDNEYLKSLIDGFIGTLEQLFSLISLYEDTLSEEQKIEIIRSIYITEYYNTIEALFDVGAISGDQAEAWGVVFGQN